MRGALLLRNLSLYARNRHFSLYLRPTSLLSNVYTDFSPKIDTAYNAQPLNWFPSRTRRFSSDDGTQDPDPNPESESSTAEPKEKEADAIKLDGVDSKEFKKLLLEYFPSANEKLLRKVSDAVLKRALSGKHEETDDELICELRRCASENANDEEFESDLEDGDETDEEIVLLMDAKDYVVRKMKADPFFNMDDCKWDAIVKESTEGGYLENLKECEDLLEDMQNWDTQLPDEIKQKIQVKFNEINDMIDRGEVSFDEGFELYHKYEDQIVSECKEIIKREEKKHPANENEIKVQDDRRGKGPELRWVTRVVLSPGGDSWHPKNRKAKLSTTVAEYGLSKYQFMRLRELAGKRYNPGKDELTITSERFEHREENRKDCLRTLIALIEEARKADEMVHEARVSFTKDRLKANPVFMQRLLSKKKAPSTILEA